MACALGKRRSILLSYEGRTGSILNSRPERLLSFFNYWREKGTPGKKGLYFTSPGFDFACLPDCGVQPDTATIFSDTGEF